MAKDLSSLGRGYFSFKCFSTCILNFRAHVQIASENATFSSRDAPSALPQPPYMRASAYAATPIS